MPGTAAARTHRCREGGSVLFDNVDFKKVKIDLLDKRILPEAGFGMAFKFMDVAVKPHGLPKVKLRADVLDGGEDLVRPRIVFIAADHGIPKHPVIFENFCP